MKIDETDQAATQQQPDAAIPEAQAITGVGAAAPEARPTDTDLAGFVERGQAAQNAACEAIQAAQPEPAEPVTGEADPVGAGPAPEPEGA